MRRAWPFLLFGAITLTVFWPFLWRGETLFVMALLEEHLVGIGDPPSPDGTDRHARIVDNILLLPTNLRIYNDALKAGELGLWNPTLFCGYPIYSDPMVHPFYPPNLLLHLAFAPHTAYGLALLLHFFFSGAAMFWALRTMGRSDAAATVGGVLWMLLGYNAMWFSTAVLLGTSVFGPLALAAIVKGLEKRDLRLAAWAGLAMGMAVLGSHPQHALHFFLFLAGWLILRWTRNRESRPFVRRFGGLFALVTVGVGLAEVLARLDSIANGYRDPEGGDMRSLYGEPGLLLSFLLSLVLGKVHFPANPYLEYEFTVYAGFAATALAVTGAARAFRDPETRFTAVLGAAALLVAFALPLATLVHAVPLLNLSPPARWIYVAGFCLALLAARGVDELRSGPRPGSRTIILVATGTYLASVLVAPRREPLHFAGIGGFETFCGIILAAVAAFLAARRPRTACALGLAAVLVDLLPFFLLFNPHSDRSRLDQVPGAVAFARDREKEPWRGTGALGSVHSTETELFGPEVTTGNNLLALYGVENPAGFEAIIPVNHVRFMQAAGGRIDPVGRSIKLIDFTSQLLDVAGLKYLFIPFNLKPPDRFRLLGEFGKVKVYENVAAWPRATMDAGGKIDARIDWVERRANRLVLDVDAPRAGRLVVADTHYPGWEATVDGKPVEIGLAHLSFRAVDVREGRQRIEFRFRPECVTLGLPISGLFTLAALAFALRRRATA